MQSQANAGGIYLLSCFKEPELLEKFGLVFFFYADSSIFNSYFYFTVFYLFFNERANDCHRTTRGCKLESVALKVEQDLLKPLHIGAN